MGAPVTLVDDSAPAGKPLGSLINPFIVAQSNGAGGVVSPSVGAGIYRRAANLGATQGDGVLVTGVTTAGTVTLTLGNGGTVVISVPLGSTVLPFGVTAAALGTAIGGTFQSLFFT